MFVTGLVLAAGGSSRLGRPKQLLPFSGGTLLGATVQMAQRCAFDQLIVTLGAVAQDVLDAVDLGGAEVVYGTDHTSGCASSIAAGVRATDPSSDGIVLLLGDQPGVHPEWVARLVAQAAGHELAVCRYVDGRGHPIWLGRQVFADLLALHGDKGVWRMLDSPRFAVHECPVDAPLPGDVDTWADYQALLSRAQSTP